jgi:hypothetical protein
MKNSSVLLAFIGIEMIHLLGWIGPLAALVGFLALALAINRMLFDPVEKQQIGQAFRAMLSRRQRDSKESISSDGINHEPTSRTLHRYCQLQYARPSAGLSEIDRS